jgi:hypothetical protein
MLWERAQAGPASPSPPARPDAPTGTLVAVACVSAALLMTELALTRIFSVVMYWAWGMNGAFSVLGSTLAIFIAMNWGFQVTLFAASATYLVALAALLVAEHRG